MARTFYIVGAGMGAPDGLTGEARRALDAADAVLATAPAGGGARPATADLSVRPDWRRTRGGGGCDRPVAVLVSGDVGFFSAAARLRGAACAARGRCGWCAACPACSTFCAKLGASV